jgi:hypothetical protein
MAGSLLDTASWRNEPNRDITEWQGAAFAKNSKPRKARKLTFVLFVYFVVQTFGCGRQAVLYFGGDASSLRATDLL